MKKAIYCMMTAGLIVLVVALFTTGHLNSVNAVDSHPWTININGIHSFAWPEFCGGLLIALGGIFNIATWQQKKYRVG
ncbi:hypothetical protein [Pedobacter psychrodurus]|uniref:hypothetical protein n=1 Tax=Pedobacter psychrodurus TaxID=2530456 RepID=UPI0029318B64|nr:hypothetical protein [Pedobacter psychrodurus]